MYLICFDLKIEDELKQSKFQSNLHKAVVNIMFTSGWVYNQFREIFKSYQLTHQQYNVLRILRGKYPQALNPSDIKSVMLDKNPDLTRLCDRLCEMGYIDREVDSVNKRKMNIKINEKGLDILKEIDPLMEHFNNSRFDLSEEEAEQLSSLLDKVRG
jgi:DNA-binding MarR family transcriptional regulator